MQDFFALLIVAIAAGYLTRAAWLRFVSKRVGGCGTCGGCGTEKQLVQIHSLNISLAEAQRSQSQISRLK
jgi:hypothetical protein